MIIENAYAKINLYLDVTAKRSDGFHDVESVMQTVSLCDVLSLSAEPAQLTDIRISIEGASLPTDRSNLVYRAALAYLERARLSADVDIKLMKNIPIAAGLAGGSSDAAATLRAMNRRFGALTEEELRAVAASLGSDIPFCLLGGTAICRGRGELIEPIRGIDAHAVVAIGTDRISTPEAYARLDRIYSNFDGSIPTDADNYLRELLESMKNEVALPTDLYNIFETEIEKNAKSVTKIKAEMLCFGATATLMSGSGPSVFGIFTDGISAERACDELAKKGYRAYAVKFVN